MARLHGGPARLDGTAPEKVIGGAISRLLNERLGNSPSAPGCGVSDFGDLFRRVESGRPVALVVLREEIKTTLEMCEPRLTDVNVREPGDGGRTAAIRRFTVEARLRGGTELRFSAEVAAPGVLELADHEAPKGRAR
jgi:predicted component of type VI protein secretion system